MTERRKTLLWTGLLLAILMVFFSRILFTDKIVRAPDIINEFYWGVKDIGNGKFADLFRVHLQASWNPYVNSGSTVEGGDVSLGFLIWRNLLFWAIPAPANVAWFMVCHLFFGAMGTYLCCRMVGAGRMSSFFGGLIFALSPEIASLINAGHVMKIATIAYAPWAFFCLEKGFLSKRLVWFMATSIVLAFQFFNTHWQIAFYTCLCVGLYGIIRTVGIMQNPGERNGFPARRLVISNLVVLALFLTTVSISLVPLANWSTGTNRGIQSGANQGKGGLDRDEAMSWSMPPEESLTFVIPGFFGFSRQEAGPNPANITSFYWGRMVFTQTTSYMGLIPWLLLPLPLIFRRDKYTWLAVTGIIGGILFSMGKYTPFYNVLFDFFPGINRFRVPKMMMFIPVIALGVLSARGMDLLTDQQVRATKAFRRYLAGITALPVALCLLMVSLYFGKDFWIRSLYDMLAAPTRYEQGVQLVGQRWTNCLIETGVAAVLAALAALAMVFCTRIQRISAALPVLLVMIYLADVWRVDDKFLFTVDSPETSRRTATPTMAFIKAGSKQYRVLPMDGSDPMQYASRGIPVLYTSNAVQQQRWQSLLDSFVLNSAMPDMLNVTYLIYAPTQYEKEKTQLGDKFQPVFRSPDGAQIVLENRSVLPKAWLVPSVAVVTDPAQRLGILQNPGFNPRSVALVESPPPALLANPGQALPLPLQSVSVPVYEGERIVVRADSAANALLVLGEKYYKGWRATADGKPVEIVPVNHILRGVYLPPGKHTVEFVFDPLPFRIGTYLTLASFALFAVMLAREWRLRRRKARSAG